VATIKFVKMHGLGNDFIIIELSQFDNINNKEEFIRSISNRNTGIGCDQFIIYEFDGKQLCFMWIYNSDGTIAKACGNGTRCLAKLISEQYSILNLQIKTQNRMISSNIIGKDISVNMGKESFEESWMPNKKDILDIANLFDISQKEIQCVDVSNPHLVVFSSYINENDRRIFIDKIHSSNLFKDGVNISFAKINGNIIDLYVWERGVGETLACGSAACASFAAAYKLGFIKDNEAYIKFKLGLLKLNYQDDDIIMTGPAAKIIYGDYYYESK
jgi:diaminopimelate epimerase